jgi:hypothetical protein
VLLAGLAVLLDVRAGEREEDPGVRLEPLQQKLPRAASGALRGSITRSGLAGGVFRAGMITK